MRWMTIACWASFWPKKATSGPTALKSFATTVVTPRKCAGPRLAWIAVEHVGQAATDVDRRREALWVDLIHRGGVDEVDAAFLRELEVARLVSRIGIQVLGGPELRGVHEEAHHHDVASLASGPQKRQVAVVEVAHRGHQADGPALAARRRERLAQVGLGSSHPHVATSSRAASAFARSASDS